MGYGNVFSSFDVEFGQVQDGNVRLRYIADNEQTMGMGLVLVDAMRIGIGDFTQMGFPPLKL